MNEYGITAVICSRSGRPLRQWEKHLSRCVTTIGESEALLQSGQKLAEVALASGVPLGKKTIELTSVSTPYNGSSVDILVNVCHVAVPVGQRTLYRDSTQGNLLSDEATTAVSAGDSSALTLFGLNSVLSSELKTSVLDAAIEGPWFTSGIMNYLLRTASAQARPEVIFWTAINLQMTSAVLKELKPALVYAFLPRKVVATWDMDAGRVPTNLNLDPNKRYFIGVTFTGAKAEYFQYHVNTDLGSDTQLFARRESATAPTYTTTLYSL